MDWRFLILAALGGVAGGAVVTLAYWACVTVEAWRRFRDSLPLREFLSASIQQLFGRPGYRTLFLIGVSCTLSLFALSRVLHPTTHA